MYKSLEGRSLQKEILQKIQEDILRTWLTPSLAVILVGNNEASLTYIAGKKKACESVGIAFRLIHLPQDTPQVSVLSEIERINQDPSIHGLLVQFPLPSHITPQSVIDAIDPKKDVDGFTKDNIADLYLARDHGLVSCTPKWVLALIWWHGYEVSGKHAVVIGRSTIVGRPLALLLSNAGATVTLAHSKTIDLIEHTKRADILIVAIGKARYVTADMVKEWAIVIDIGINRLAENKICGDTDYEEIIKKAHCSPVPGGVGPMTIAMLLQNTMEAYKNQTSIS